VEPLPIGETLILLYDLSYKTWVFGSLKTDGSGYLAGKKSVRVSYEETQSSLALFNRGFDGVCLLGFDVMVQLYPARLDVGEIPQKADPAG